MDDYTEEMQKYLFLMTARLLGWPMHPNRWLYPDIFRWDRTSDGQLLIPALITFYPNPLTPFTLDHRRVFQKQLTLLVPGYWDFDYQRISGAIICERKDQTIYVQESERDTLILHRPTYELLPRQGLWRRLFDHDGTKARAAPRTPVRDLAMRRMRKEIQQSNRLR